MPHLYVHEREALTRCGARVPQLRDLVVAVTFALSIALLLCGMHYLLHDQAGVRLVSDRLQGRTSMRQTAAAVSS